MPTEKSRIIKASVLFLLVAAIVFSFIGCSESKADFTKFNGIPFGATQKEVMPQIEAMLKKQKYEGEVEEKVNHKDNYKTIEDTFENVKVDDYTADLTVTFINNEDDDITNSKFCDATYYFDHMPQYKAEQIIEYYKNRFDKLYGKATADNTDNYGSRYIAWNTDGNKEGCSLMTWPYVSNDNGELSIYLSYYSNTVKHEFTE